MVDVYDALTTDHPYKLALSPEDALEQIHAEAEMGLAGPGVGGRIPAAYPRW